MGRSPLTRGIKSINERVDCAVADKEHGHANRHLNLLQSLLCCLSHLFSCILMGMLSRGKFASTEERRVENIQKWAKRGLTKWKHSGDFLGLKTLSR